jgi:hypothetical protein
MKNYFTPIGLYVLLKLQYVLYCRLNRVRGLFFIITALFLLEVKEKES